MEDRTTTTSTTTTSSLTSTRSLHSSSLEHHNISTSISDISDQNNNNNENDDHNITISTSTPVMTFPISFRVASTRMDHSNQSPMTLDKENCHQPHNGPVHWMDTDRTAPTTAVAVGSSLLTDFQKPSLSSSSLSYPTSTTPGTGSMISSSLVPAVTTTAIATIKTAAPAIPVSSPLTPRQSMIPIRPTSTTGTPTTTLMGTKVYRQRVVKCRRRHSKTTMNEKSILKSSSSSRHPSMALTTSPFEGNESTSATDDDLAVMDVDGGIPDPYDTCSEQSSVYDLAAELALETTPVRYSFNPSSRNNANSHGRGSQLPNHHEMEIRRECINPVALTLWRDGHEDWHNLNSRDRSFLAARTGYFTTTTSSPASKSSPSSSSIPSPRPFGSDLHHVAMTMTTTTTNIPSTTSSTSCTTDSTFRQQYCMVSRPIPTRRQVHSPQRHGHIPPHYY